MKTFFLFIILLPLSCLAQVSVSGKIIDHKDKEPIPNASIFLANGTIGDQSSPDGRFRLKSVKPGKYELVVSMIGYETYHQNVTVENADIALPDIDIKTKTNVLREVKITNAADPNRNRYLDWFTDEFIGTSDIARQCKIINPEILNLSYDWKAGVLTAASDGFLIIENDALGYKLNYLLTSFTLNNKDIYNKEVHYEGSVFFKEMPGKPSQVAAWEEMRQQVYQNSATHFFRSVLKNNMENEGFRVYQVSVQPNPKRPDQKWIDAEMNYYNNAPSTVAHRKDSLAYWIKKSKLPKSFKTLMRYPLSKKDIIRSTSQPGLCSFTCDNDALYVTYSKSRHFKIYNNVEHLEPSNNDVTIINFADAVAMVDENGGITNPNSLAFDGVWARKRIGDLLPLNYEPIDNEEKADTAVTQKVISKLTAYFATHVTEKAYLHFDKPYYAAGDTIYFKAYLTNSESRRLSQLSNVLHVDLVNPKNHIDQSIKLLVNNGVAWGEFNLPDTLLSGNYMVRAYTQLMRNNEEAGYFDKVIPVKAVKKMPANVVALIKDPQNSNNRIDIQFFPEGGDLLVGNRCKVAFKAINASGLGVNIKGKIIDNDNNEICAFASQHLGMGYFYLEPQENKKYRAEVVYADGFRADFDLPQPQVKGIALSITNISPGEAQVTLNATNAFYRENNNKNFTVLVYSGGDVTSYVLKLKEPVVSATIQKGQFSSGVARVTLFSPNGEPLSERMIFIRRPDLLTLQVAGDRPAYAKRGKVKISINAAKDDKPVMGHFSVAVVDDGRIPVDDNSEHTILTYLLLTSELKGYIEKPNYYFMKDSKEVTDELDVLMLTQGYRRFEWKQVLNSKADKLLAFHAERSLELGGMVKSMSGRPAAGNDLILIDNKDDLLMDTTTDKSGIFKFTNLFVTDTPFMILQAKKNNKPQNVTIAVKGPEVLPLVSQSVALKYLNDTVPQQAADLMQQNFVDKAHSGIKLKQVTIKGYKPRPKPDLSHSANLNGPGNANFVIMGDQLTGCMNIDCLKGKIPGTIWKGNTLYSRRTGERLGENPNAAISFPPPPMAIFIDGMLIPQSSDPLGTLNMSDIYSIEVLESGSYLALYGSNAMGGALIVTTKRGINAPQQNAETPGLIRFPFNGFYKSREFYSPKYEHPVENDKQRDLRSTIYWQPELLTDKDGNASFEYYNADGQGTYRVIVEGIDERGNIGRQLYRYKVE